MPEEGTAGDEDEEQNLLSRLPITLRCPQAMKSLRAIKEIAVEFDNPTTKHLSIFLSTSKFVQNNLCKLIAVSFADEYVNLYCLKCFLFLFYFAACS